MYYILNGDFMKKIKNIEDRVIKSLKAHHVVYDTVDSKKYKILKIMQLISGAFAAFMIVFFLLGQYIYYNGAVNGSEEAVRQFMPTAILFSVTTLLLVVGIILSLNRKALIGAIFTVCPLAVQLIAIIPEMHNVHLSRAGLHQNYWWRHFAPSVICIFAATYCAYILLKAKHIEDRAYKNMVENIYAQNKDATELSEEEWIAFLENYDPRQAEEERRMAKKGITPKLLISEEENKE